MKSDKNKNFKIFVLIIIFVSMAFSVGYTYAEVSEASSDSVDITAILYDTTEYSLDAATKLTESGVEINDWQYNTSKYLQINPRVPDDGNIYKVIVELPQEFYVVTDELALPSGYANVDFTKNDAINVNESGKYSLEKYSGTIEYTMSKLQTSGTIQLELRYDTILWDKQTGSSLTPSGVFPIKVRLEKVNNSSDTNILKELSVSKVTAGSNMIITLSSNFDTPSGTIHGGDYVAKLTDEITQKINLSSYASATSYFEKFTLEFNFPYYTDSAGNKHYLTYDASGFDLPSFASSKTEIIEETGKLVISIPNSYFNASSINLLKFKYINPSEMLSGLSGDSFAFSGGSVKVYVDGKNESTDNLLGSLYLGRITYDKTLNENVVLSSTAKSVTLIERPDNAVSQIGGFYLENKGTADSSAKTILQEFDTGNTGLLKVTTINVLADPIQQYIDIEYTLVDENNERVYLDEEGNRVTSDTEGAFSSWTYSIENSAYNSTATINLRNKFTRSMLPKVHQEYYFKSIKFTLSTVKAGTRLYAPSATSTTMAAGNIYAYVEPSATNGAKVANKMTVTSSDPSIKVATKTFNTTLSSTSTTAYQVSKVSMSKSSIEAGDSLVLNANVQEISYPYGNSTWLKGITLGFILPVGVSINEQAITAQFANKTQVTGMTVDTPVDVGNGNMLWKVRFAADTYIGYATENLTGFTNSSINNEYISFSVQLDTAYTMNTSTLFAADMVFVAGYKQNNAASGSYSYASKVDTYDLNENGSVTDKIGGIDAKSTVSCQITPHAATLDVSDSATVTSNGSISEESNDLIIKSSKDIITYNLDIGCHSGGQVDSFEYYIPVPKKENLKDDFLLSGSAENSFGLALRSSAIISGSSIFSIEYAFDEGLNYESVKGVKTWYTENQVVENNLMWQDVTMIKITIAGGILYNGDSSRISIDFIYDGNNYATEAGKENIWSSGGYFNYINNGREMAGNFATKGIKVKLNYEQVLDDIILTAAKDMKPKIDGNVNLMDIYEQLPKFVKKQSFSIGDIETYNVKLQEKNYIINNVDMSGVEANQTFALTVALNNGQEYEILPNDKSNIGINPEGTIPKLTFKLYNANSLSENIQSRYVILNLVSDNGVNLKQKIIINREVTKKAEVIPSISAGKSYNALSDVNTTAVISQDQSFTAQFVTEYTPALYKEQKIVFSEILPEGTALTLVNKRESIAPTYWYYKVKSDDVSEIVLSDFKEMGKVTNSNYNILEDSEITEENFIVVVDFADCTKNLDEGAYSVKMVFTGKSVADFNSTSLSFVSKIKRNFNLSSNVSSVEIGEKFTIDYSLSDVLGAEPSYFGKKMSLVIKTDKQLPLDSYIALDDSKYYMNTENQFIIPLGEVQNGSGKLELSFVSDILSSDDIEYEVNIDLLVSATANGNLPNLGKVVANKTIKLIGTGVDSPSLKVTEMLERLIEVDSLQNENSLVYEYLSDGNCDTTIELYQKVGSGYQKLTNALTQVNGSTEHNMGAFELSSVDGSNIVKFRLSSILQIGTYRMILKTYDKSGNELLLVPYNFIIVE